MASELVYRNYLPRIIIALVTIIYTLARITGNPFLNDLRAQATLWGTIIAYWATIPPVVASLMYQVRRMSRNREQRNKTFWKAVVVIATFLLFYAMAFLAPGAVFPFKPNVKTDLYKMVYLFGISVATQGIWYLMLTGYTLEAAYRSMKLTSLDAVAFLIPCFVWLMRGMPVVGVAWNGIFDLGYWFMGVVNWGGTVGPTIAALLTSMIYAMRSAVAMEKRVVMEV
jgi:hypothetical protein